MKKIIECYDEDDYFGSYVFTTKRMCVEFTERSFSKTLIMLGKNLYDWDLCDAKREKTLEEGLDTIQWLSENVMTY